MTYARNLTPDAETGLGSWTAADIEKALRPGQRPDGSPILPPMPWPNYSRMTAEDMQALVAYVESLSPVSHRVPDRVPPGGTPKTPVPSFPIRRHGMPRTCRRRQADRPIRRRSSRNGGKTKAPGR